MLSPSTVDWSGFYAGANVGYAWNDVETKDSFLQTDGVVFGIGPVLPVQKYSAADDKASLGGWFGGLQAGYQRQFDQFVGGVETDIQWGDFENSKEFLGSPDGGPTYRTKAEIQYFGTVRGRAGLAFDNVLLYGTGGLAYGEGRGSLTITPGTPARPNGDPYPGSDNAMHVGTAVGGGIEIALSKSISVKAEYLHIDLGDETYRFDLRGSGGSFVQAKEDIETDTAKLGLNYHF